MKKITLMVFVLTFLLCGCSHTINSYSKGVGAEITWNPDSFVPSGRFGFYEFLFSMSRENSHTRFNSNAGIDFGFFSGIKSIFSLFSKEPPAMSNNIGTVVEIKTGPVASGYSREILTNPNVKPEHVEIAKAMYGVETTLPDRETTLTKDGVVTNATPKVKTKKGILSTEVETPTNEHTEEAIKKQVNPDGVVDGVKKIVIWSVFFVVISILIYAIIRLRIKNKK
jgi:hypothetical protein